MAHFLGTYAYAVDHKGRVNIPTKFRKYFPLDLEEPLVVTRGLDGCLFGYPFDEWTRVDEKLRALPITQRDARHFIRMLTSHATMVSLDRQGRIAIPKPLLDLAQITNDILFVGTLDHFEMWDPAQYEQCMNRFDKSYEEVAESIFALNKP